MRVFKQKISAILYDVILPATSRHAAQERLAESEALLKTYGGVAVLKIIQRRHHPSSTSFIGRSKLAEVMEEIEALNANLLVLNGVLKPRQLYAVEAFLESHKKKIMVWDRFSLILQLFKKHAKTAEAKLQLELARIEHFGPRIYGMGEELSQQGGGGYTTRGRGETNTELMKRHLAQHRLLVKNKLGKLQKNRTLLLKNRARRGFKSVSLVGYTNAGKSALMRALTNRSVVVEDALFATLDTVTARLFLPSVGKTVLLSDTIGFIRELPPTLIQAFKSTLLETLHASLLLHVVAISEPAFRMKMQVVNKILFELCGARIPILTVYNKVDLLQEKSPQLLAKLKSETSSANPAVFVSAEKKTNLTALKLKICEILLGIPTLPTAKGRAEVSKASASSAS